MEHTKTYQEFKKNGNTKGEASIIYSIGRHRFIELARAAGATYKINEGTDLILCRRIFRP